MLKDEQIQETEGLQNNDEIQPEEGQEPEVKEAEKQPEPKEEGEAEAEPEAKPEGEEGKEAEPAEEEPPTIDEIRENVKKHDEALKDDREEFGFYETKLQTIRADVIKTLPDISGNGKSIYDMNQDEFDSLVDKTYATAQDRSKAAELVADARAARKQYQEKIQPYIQSAQKLQADAQAHREKEWNLAEKELKALYPGIGKFDAEIREKAIKELESNPLLVERVNQGVSAKFKYLINLVKEAGIEERLNKEELKQEQGNRSKALAGKGKGSSGSESRETAYTPEQIRKMSLDEYRKNKDKILAQSRRGKK